MKKFFILCGIFFLSGCAGRHFEKADLKDFEGFNTGKKGIVLFLVTENLYPTYKNSKNVGLDYTLINLEAHAKEADNASAKPLPVYYKASTTQALFNHRANYASKMLFLEPGLYLINRINLLERINSQKWYKDPSPFDKEKVVALGAFEVRANEIISLGRLDVTNDKFTFIREDDKIKSDLEKAGYGYLIPRIKPGTFYESGSVIMGYTKKKNNFHWEIISRQELEGEMGRLVR